MSGDFIDYFRISERYLGFYIADVSGHGAAAAFVTMTLKSLFNQPIRQFRVNENELAIDPGGVLKYLNTELINANLGKHISVFYGVIDCDTDTLHYAVAGQYPAPLMINQSKMSFLNEGGFPLGLFDWANFENRQRAIADDFQLLMVSDGWLELISEDSAPAKESFLLNYVQSNQISIPTLMRPVKKYPENKMPDDITIFIVNKE